MEVTIEDVKELIEYLPSFDLEELNNDESGTVYVKDKTGERFFTIDYDVWASRISPVRAIWKSRLGL